MSLRLADSTSQSGDFFLVLAKQQIRLIRLLWTWTSRALTIVPREHARKGLLMPDCGAVDIEIVNDVLQVDQRTM